jgi:hypothetical protein
VGCPRACCARPERRKTTARKCSSDAGKWTLGVAEQHVGVEVVLLRARGRRLRRCSELSTMARRWRPEMARGVVARARAARKGEESGRNRGEMTRGWCSSWRWSSGACADDERRW